MQPRMTTLTPSKADQLAALDAAAQAAALAGSQILVVPELYLTGYNLAAFFEVEERGGASYVAVQAIAVRRNVSILYTYPEKDPASAAVYDSAALIYRNGTSLADYRKVNLASGEDLLLTPGSSFAPVVVVDGVRVGVLICFDIFLPEPARILALSEAEVILVPTANGYPLGINVLATLIVPARALENNAFVAYVNWVQDNSTWPAPFVFHGQTAVSDPGGSLLYLGPADQAELAHIPLNFSGFVPGSTALGRPWPDLVGLCNNVTSSY